MQEVGTTRNASAPNVGTDWRGVSPKSIEVSALHLANARTPMVVTAGKETEVSDLQPWNAYSSMSIATGRETEVSA